MVADRNPPTLRNFDEHGQRVDEDRLSPAFVEMQKLGFSASGSPPCPTARASSAGPAACRTS
jgi:hypothetical protein